MEHVNNVVVDDMYILIPWGKEHAIDEVCRLRRRIGEDRRVYVLDEWLNGGAMEAEISRYLDISINRQVLSRTKVKLKLCKLRDCWVLIVCKAHVLGEEEELCVVEYR